MKQLKQTISIFIVFLTAGLLMILIPYRIDLNYPETEKIIKKYNAFYRQFRDRFRIGCILVGDDPYREGNNQLIAG